MEETIFKIGDLVEITQRVDIDFGKQGKILKYYSGYKNYFNIEGAVHPYCSSQIKLVKQNNPISLEIW